MLLDFYLNSSAEKSKIISKIGEKKLCPVEMKKGNKQCLFDTPRTVMVNKENDIRTQRP